MAKKTATAGRQDKVALWQAVRVLLGVSLGISAYLAWKSLTDSGVAGCGPDSGCDRVLRSRWSAWLGIPVSLPALLVYAGALAMTLRLKPPTPAAGQRRARAVLIVCATTILGAVLWFVALQVVVIRAFCPYCMVAHGTGSLAAILILTAAPFAKPQGKRPKHGKAAVIISPPPARRLVMASVACLAVLVAGQLLHRPKSFEVSTLDEEPPARSATTAAPATSMAPTNTVSSPPEAAEAGHRTIPFFRGAIRLDLSEVPLLGTSNAPVVIVCLRDYACHFCRDLHGHLREVHRTLGDQVAIVSLPVPLNTNCNSMIRRTPRDHENSCEYARLALAVWRAQPEKMEEFDEWILTPERPPSPDVVKAHAEHLVGTNELARAMADPWIDRLLHQGMSIYATNAVHYGQTRMPQTFIGRQAIVGTVSGPGDIYSILAKHPGFELPAALRPAGN